jgi:membrane protein
MKLLHRIETLRLLRKSFQEFRENDPLRMAGATAFFTTFALPAVLIILIQVFGLIINPRMMTRQLLKNLADIVGSKTASELHKTLINVHHLSSTWYFAAGGFLFLIFVSTTLFKVIKDSLNQLWNIRMKAKVGITFNLLNRAKSFIVILFTGILFLSVLMTEGLLNFLSNTLHDQFPEKHLMLNLLVNQGISLLVVTIWFTMIFKFLPDGHPAWKIAITGGFFTGILFSLGKLLLKWLLSYSNMQTIYGASASSALLLLFVFYAALIFYYGACFTNVWAVYRNKPIQPGKNAVIYKWSPVKGTKIGADEK